MLQRTAVLCSYKQFDSAGVRFRKIIFSYKNSVVELGADKEKLSQLMQNAEENEKNSNQILDFTKDIKYTDQNFKIKIIESLWKIIFSDNISDMYESNLMRRLSGLLYLDNKLVGDIKEKIKKDFNK